MNINIVFASATIKVFIPIKMRQNCCEEFWKNMAEPSSGDELLAVTQANANVATNIEWSKSYTPYTLMISGC